jgi:hypothetical protein
MNTLSKLLDWMLALIFFISLVTGLMRRAGKDPARK